MVVLNTCLCLVHYSVTWQWQFVTGWDGVDWNSFAVMYCGETSERHILLVWGRQKNGPLEQNCVITRKEFLVLLSFTTTVGTILDLNINKGPPKETLNQAHRSIILSTLKQNCFYTQRKRTKFRKLYVYFFWKVSLIPF